MYLVIFLDMLGFGVLIPLVRDLTQLLVAKSGILWPSPEIYMGVLMASYSGAQMLSSPWLGRLSDIYGRKPIFLFSAIGNVASYAIWIIANNYWLFLAGRILSGATGGNIAIAQSIIADKTTPEERPKAMGILGACIGMGFVLGPFLGGVLININHKPDFIMTDINPYWLIGAACFVLSVISMLMIVFSHIDRVGGSSSQRQSLGSLFGVFSQRHGRSVLTTHLLSQLSFVGFEVLFAWVLQKQYQMDLKDTYYFFGFQGVLLALVQGGIYRRMEKRKPPELWVKLGLIVSAAGMLILPWVGFLDGPGGAVVSTKLILLLAVLALMALALGFGGPSINAYASIHAPKNEQGQMMGHMQSMAALARFAMPVLATSLYALWLPLPFIAGAVLCLAAWMIFSRRGV